MYLELHIINSQLSMIIIHMELINKYSKPINIPQTNSTQQLQSIIYLTYQIRWKKQCVWMSSTSFLSLLNSHEERGRGGKVDNWELTIKMYSPAPMYTMDRKNFKPKLWTNYLISRAPNFYLWQLVKSMPWTELGMGARQKSRIYATVHPQKVLTLTNYSCDQCGN